MNLIKQLFLGLLAFFLVVLDTAFFSNLPFFGATIISSFVAMVVISLFVKLSDCYIFSSVATISMSIFSSVSVFSLLLVFFVIPSAIYYLRKYYIKDLNPLAAIPFFTGSFLIFDLILMMSSKEYGNEAFLAMGYFAVINTVFGAIIYSIIRYFRKNILYNKGISV